MACAFVPTARGGFRQELRMVTSGVRLNASRGLRMSDTKWTEQVCRIVCRKKGIPEAEWETEKPAVQAIIEAIKETGAVVVPILGDVE